LIGCEGIQEILRENVCNADTVVFEGETCTSVGPSALTAKGTIVIKSKTITNTVRNKVIFFSFPLCIL
jgi:hypothetical protein